jgi:hypothetical protein
MDKTINFEELTKGSAAGLTFDVCDWLMKTILLGKYQSWADSFSKRLNTKYVFIDNISDYRLSDNDIFELAKDGKPLYMEMGRLLTLKDLKKTNKFYSSESIEVEDGICIYDVDKQSPALLKNRSSALLLARDNSLSLHVSALKSLKISDIEYHITTDEFNLTCSVDSIPFDVTSQLLPSLTAEQVQQAKEEMLDLFLKPLYDDIEFVICGEPPLKNRWSEQIKWRLTKNI